MFRNLAAAVASFLRRDDGPTAVEYAVMMALIIVVCFAATVTLGTKTNSTYTTVSNQLGRSSSS